MREGDGKRRMGMCQTTGQGDILDMHGSPLDKHMAEREVEVQWDPFFLHVCWTLLAFCNRG